MPPKKYEHMVIVTIKCAIVRITECMHLPIEHGAMALLPDPSDHVEHPPLQRLLSLAHALVPNLVHVLELIQILLQLSHPILEEGHVLHLGIELVLDSRAMLGVLLQLVVVEVGLVMCVAFVMRVPRAVVQRRA